MNQLNELIELTNESIRLMERDNNEEANYLLVKIYRLVKENPKILNTVKNYSSLSTVFLAMIDLEFSEDVDTLQTVSSLAYLFICKAIENDSQNVNFIKNRIVILYAGHDYIKYTVMSAFEDKSNSASYYITNQDIKARDILYKMEISDLFLNPSIYKQVSLLEERKKKFDALLDRQFFMPELTLKEVIGTGIKNHNKLFTYLQNKILIDNDVIF